MSEFLLEKEQEKHQESVSEPAKAMKRVTLYLTEYDAACRSDMHDCLSTPELPAVAKAQ